jgi:cell division protein ZapB
LTVARTENYSVAVNNTEPALNVEAELKGLETRMSELLTLVHRLSEENRALRTRQELMSAERNSLLNRSDQVRTRVESMIARLKLMEHSA